jgi:hypothetical protein
VKVYIIVFLKFVNSSRILVEIPEIFIGVKRAKNRRPLSESESYVTTDGQPGSLSWSKAPIWGLRPDLYYMCDSYGLVLVGRPL